MAATADWNWPEFRFVTSEDLYEIGELSMTKTLTRFLLDERGASAIEYVLVVSLGALLIVSAVTNLGNDLSGTFDLIAGTLT